MMALKCFLTFFVVLNSIVVLGLCCMAGLEHKGLGGIGGGRGGKSLVPASGEGSSEEEGIKLHPSPDQKNSTHNTTTNLENLGGGSSVPRPKAPFVPPVPVASSSAEDDHHNQVEEEGTAGFPPPPPKNPHERKTRNPTETETHTVMRDDPFLRPPVESRLEIGTEKQESGPFSPGSGGKTQLDRANEKFDLCCRQAGITCVQCRSGGDIFAPEKAACIWQNMAAFLSCANEGKDNSKCCTEAGVDSGLLYDCKHMCESEFSSSNPLLLSCNAKRNEPLFQKCMLASFDPDTPTASVRLGHCVNKELCESPTKAKP